MRSFWPWKKRRARGELLLEELEPRILYSADAAALLQPDVSAPQSEMRSLDAYAVALPQPGAASALAGVMPPAETAVPVEPAGSAESGVASEAGPVTHEIAFVDAGDPNFQALVDDLRAQPDPGRRIDVVVIDGTRDGVEQVSAALAGRRDIDAVHLISHGTDGAIVLGSSVLSAQNIAGYEAQIAAWGEALGGHRDLLIYGCDVAGNDAGRALVDAIARLTGADVAASTDPTGNAALGGDWALEYRDGNIDTPVAVSPTAQQSWDGLLDISTGLVALWKFDANAADASGNGNSGTLSNGAAIDTATGTNKVGAGKLSLDGVNDYMDLSAHVGSVSSLAQGSIAAWIKTSGSGEKIFGTNNTAYTDSAVELRVSATGKLMFDVWSANTGLLQVRSNVSINDGLWHHVAVTVDGTGNKLYIDGVQAAVSYDYGNASTRRFFSDMAGADKLLVGEDWNSVGPNAFYSGLIDDLRVYNRALAAADVAQLLFINDPPANTVPAAQGTSEDSARVFSTLNGNPISIADADAGGANNQVTLSVTSGTLTLGSSGGLSFVSGSGIADTSMTFRGTAGAINAAMNGMRFDPTPDYNGGATLTLSTRDSVLLSLDIDSGLLGRYNFEDAGALGADSGPGVANDGSVSGATAVVDLVRGNVLGLAGAGAVQVSGLLGSPVNVTLAAWVNLMSADTAGAEVISLGDNVLLRLDHPTDKLAAYVHTGGGSFSIFNYNTTLAGTGWRHVAFTFNDTTNTAVLYLDGAAVSTTSTGATINYSLGSDSFIGKHGNGNPSLDFSGRIDDARIYNRALSAGEIGTLAGDLSMTDTDTVAITVAAVDDAPLAAADAFSVNEDATLAQAWWNAAWTRRSQITLDGNTFAGATGLADFPVLVTLNSANIDYSLTQNGGEDLRFFDADGTPLAYQVDSWNESGNSYVWVRVPQVDTSGTDSISMYYGNAAATAGQNAAAVWNSDFRAVYHLGDSGSTIADSTANANNGTATNGPVAVNGRIGGDLSLDGVNDYVNLGSNRSLLDGAAGATLSAWVNPASVAGTSTLLGASINNGGVATAASRLAVETIGSNIHVIVRSDDATLLTVDTTTNPLAAGIWQYVSTTVDLAAGTVAIYVDGVLQASTTAGSLAGTSFPGTPSASATLGANEDGNGPFLGGQIDEARFANVARSVAWQKAEYLALSNAFVTVGAAASAPATGGVLGNDTDIDSTLVSAVLVGGPGHAASFTLNADGTFTYIPVADFNGTDTFTYKANDGSLDSAVATATITVNAVNDAPVIANLAGDSLAYSEGSGALVIDQGSAALVTDIDSANFDTGSLTVTISSGNAPAEDVLAIRDQGSGTGQIGLSGVNVTYGGVAFGTFTGGAHGASLVVTFNAAADAAAVSALINNVTYRDADTTTLAAGGITVSYTLTDGDGGTSVAANATVNISAVNTAPTFTVSDGVVTTPIGSGDDWGRNMVVQADGKIVVAGYASNGSDDDFAIARYNSDGTLDTTFGTGGRVLTNFGSVDQAWGIALQADGRILVAGTAYVASSSSTDFAVARYNTDGSLDTSFSGDGRQTVDFGTTMEDGRSAALLGDGKIVIGGSSNSMFALAKLNTDGTLDTSFGSGGKVVTDIGAGADNGYALAIQPDNAILLAGSSNNDFAVARYTAGGVLDAGFGSGGIATTDMGGSFDVATTMLLQADGRIIVGGYGNGDFQLARYTTTGALDTTFSGDGRAQTDFSGSDIAVALALQSDGKIVQAGYNGGFNLGMTRYNTDGSTDITFGNAGKVVSTVGASSFAQGAAVLANGQIVLAGTTLAATRDFVVLRYQPDGGLDISFDAVNAAVTLDGAPGFTEGGPAVVLDANVQVFDAELSNDNLFSGATLTLARHLAPNALDQFAASGTLGALTEGGALVVGGTTVGTVTANSGGTLLLTFGANATQARVNAVLQQIAYANTSVTPPGSVQIDWTFSDGNIGAQGGGGALTAVGSTAVAITAVNSAPTVSISAVPLTYTENGAVGIDTSLVVGDIDSANLAGATVRISANFAAGQDQLSFTGMLGITGSWDGTSGTLTLSGTSSVANYQAALRSIAYYNASDAPSTLTRTLEVVVTDGLASSAPVTRDVTIIAVNDAPTLAGANNLATIHEDAVANAGTQVSALLAGVSGDPDTGVAATGIAVTAVDNTHGSWQYSTNSGGTWLAFGTPDASTARLLAADASTYVRFVPGANWNGTVTGGITFAAWDMTSGAAGGTANIAAGTVLDSFNAVSYSANNGTANWSTPWVESDNSGGGAAGGLISVAAGQLSVKSDTPGDNVYREVNLAGANSATLSFDFSNGIGAARGDVVAVQISSDGGATYTTLTSFTGLTNTGSGSRSFDISAYASANTRIRFAVTSVDASQGVGFDNVQVVFNNQTGGTTAYSIQTASASINVTPVNDAPAGASHTVTTREDVAYTFNAADFGFTDTGDAPANNLGAVKIVTLSGAGTLTDNGVAVTAGQFVTAADINAGRLVFTPVANASGAGYAGFGFQVQDDGGTASGGVDLDPVARNMSIDVTPVNDAPSGANRTVSTLEGVAYTFTAADFGFTDTSDAPTNNLSAVKIVTLSGAGTLTDNGAVVTAGQFVTVADINAGRLVFTPVANASGASYAGFTFQVLDDGGAANGGIDLDPVARSMSIDVNPVNNAPTGADNTVSAFEDTPYALKLADFGFADAGDAPANNFAAVKIVSISGAGSLTDNGVAVTAGQFVTAADITAGRLVFMPVANVSGAGHAGFSFQVQDDGGTTGGGVDLDPVARSMSIDVTAVNDAPSGTSHTVTILEDLAYTFTAADFGFSDTTDTPANNFAAVKIATLPGAGTLTDNGVAVTAGQFVTAADINAGRLVFTPVANASGTGYTGFSFQVQDDDGTANGGVDLDPVARSMVIDVTSVNDAPSGAGRTVTTLEDTAYTFTAADFGFSDTGDAPTNNFSAVKIVTLSGAGTLTDNGVVLAAGQFVTVADINAGRLVFTPVANASGTGYAGFSFQVQDDGGTANGGVDLDPVARSMVIDVTSVNDAPSGVGRTITMLEDAAYTFTAADFGFTDTGDAPANNFSAVQIVTLSGAGTLTDNGVAVTAGQFVTAADINAGRLVFTPVANASGTGYAGFGFQVQDDGGTANGGVDLDPVARSMVIDVTSVNDAPAGAGRTVSTLEDTAYTFTAADFGFTDAADAPASNFTAVKFVTLSGAGALTDNGVAVTAGQFVTAADIVAGRLVFTPVANASGTGYAGFSFQVQDDGGTANGGVDLDPVARNIAIDVTSVNDAPSGADNSVATVEDAPYVFTLADFGFVDGNDAPADAFTAVKVTVLPLAGTLLDNGVAVTAGQIVNAADIAAGRLVFSAPADANGAAYSGFSFQVQDGGGVANGGVDTDPVVRHMNIDIAAVNDAPLATSQGGSIVAGTSHVFTTADFGLADPHDTPANHLLSVRILTLPAAGSLRQAGVAVSAGQWVSAAAIGAGDLVYVAPGNVTGVAFDFLVRDDGGVANGGVDTAALPGTFTMSVVAEVVPVDPGESTPTAPPGPGPAVLPGGSDPGATDGTGGPVAPGAPPRGKGRVEDAGSAAVGNLAFAPTVTTVSITLPPEAPAEAGTAMAIASRHLSVPVVAGVEQGIEGLKTLLGRLKAQEAALADQLVETRRGLGLQNVAPVALPDTAPAGERGRGIFSTTGSIELTGVVMSAGFVAWALRGGGLLASLMASVPVWRNVDPLPVLAPETDKPDWVGREDEEADREERALSRLWNARPGGDDIGDHS